MRISWNPNKFLEIIEFSRIWGIVKGFAIAEWMRTPFGHRKSDRIPAHPENTVHVSNPEQVPEQKPRPYFPIIMLISIFSTSSRPWVFLRGNPRSRLIPWEIRKSVPIFWFSHGRQFGLVLVTIQAIWGGHCLTRIQKIPKKQIIFRLFATSFFVKSPVPPDGKSL